MSSGSGGSALSTVGTIGGGIAGFVYGGPAGAAVGASLGGQLGGVLGGQQDLQPYDASPSAEEQAFMSKLQQQAAGKGPSVAEEQMKIGVDKANQNASALAAAQRGVSPALAARLAADAQAANSQNVIQQAGALRAQEQLGSQDLIGRMLASQRGTNLQAAQLNQQSNQFNTQNRNNMLSALGNAGLMYLGSQGGGGSSQGSGLSNPGLFGGNQQPAQSGNYLGDYKFSSGGVVPGKSKVAGDSKKNDTVAAMLSPGEMVIPKTVVNKGPYAIKKFAAALIKKESAK